MTLVKHYDGGGAHVAHNQRYYLVAGWIMSNTTDRLGVTRGFVGRGECEVEKKSEKPRRERKNVVYPAYMYVCMCVSHGGGAQLNKREWNGRMEFARRIDERDREKRINERNVRERERERRQIDVEFVSEISDRRSERILMVERLEGCEREREREAAERKRKKERERRLAAIGGQTGTDGYRNDGSS